MIRKEYSAGAVKLAFWFLEFKKAVQLFAEGKSREDIKQLSLAKNIFTAPTTERAKQISLTVTSRAQSLDASFYPLFLQSDAPTQKLFNLAAIMASDTLFFDFMFEVIREKFIIGANELSDSDIRIFFKHKQEQHEKAAGWTDATFDRLGRTYKAMLFEAGLASKKKTGQPQAIYRPVLDIKLQQWLETHEMELIAKALMGVR